MQRDDVFRDAIAIAVERVRRGELDRRDLLRGLAAAGLVAIAPGVGSAQAQAREVVVVNWGGDATKHFTTAWLDPFTRDTGIRTVMDGSGPSEGKMKAMVDSRRVTWDVVDTGSGTMLQIGSRYFESIDYSIVDRTKVPQGFAWEYGIANYLFSYVLAYDRSKFRDRVPTSWADFFNFRDFPGKRTIRKDIQGTLEVALMGDGVPKDRLYPIDVPRALNKLRRHKNDIIFWPSGADSQTLLREGEVTMGSLWNTRTNALVRDTNERITWTWNQGILCPGVWSIMKGAPAGRDLANRFIASTQIPERQVELFKLFGNGPANPDAAPLVPADLVRFSPGAPVNAAQQVQIQAEWYGENQTRVNDMFLDMLA
jgi:putative spermidine/putrescine transport system substrate-binding protein